MNTEGESIRLEFQKEPRCNLEGVMEKVLDRKLQGTVKPKEQLTTGQRLMQRLAERQKVHYLKG